MSVTIDGSAGVTTNTGAVYNSIQTATAVTASGASVDFTNIPPWVKRITVTMTDVSFAALGVSRIRVGTSGGLVSTNYVTASASMSNTPAIAVTSVTDGLAVISASANATVDTGQFTIVNITGNTWQCNGFNSRLADSNVTFAAGYIALGGTLTSLSLVATTSTFDGGTVNILYE